MKKAVLRIRRTAFFDSFDRAAILAPAAPKTDDRDTDY